MSAFAFCARTGEEATIATSAIGQRSARTLGLRLGPWPVAVTACGSLGVIVSSFPGRDVQIDAEHDGLNVLLDFLRTRGPADLIDERHVAGAEAEVVVFELD